MAKHYRTLRMLLAGLAGLTAVAVHAQGDGMSKTEAKPADVQRPVVAEDGTVRVPGFEAPFSSLASDAARRSYIEQHSPAFYASPIAQMQKLPIAEQRVTLDTYYLAPLIAKARKAYAVTIKPWTVGGVYTDVVEPADGLTGATKGRVLINLHGGGFVMGARTNGQLEAIPVAGLGKYKVVTVDYRQGPENRFPAGSEDVAAVYRALLKTYKPENIGIYGCSAGGLLAAQAVAWFQKENLPRPGAIGIFCASAGNLGAGDSRITAAVLNGQKAPPPSKDGDLARTPYFAGADMNDPLVSPVNHAKVIAQFPPTLVITSTRDFAMSSALDTHRQLVKAKVDAELHVWDGLQHFFFADVELPESQEAYQVMVDFFGRHLK